MGNRGVVRIVGREHLIVNQLDLDIIVVSLRDIVSYHLLRNCRVLIANDAFMLLECSKSGFCDYWRTKTSRIRRQRSLVNDLDTHVTTIANTVVHRVLSMYLTIGFCWDHQIFVRTSS